jgi:hypothetical protein
MITNKVTKLYRQFLALLGATSETIERQLQEAVEEHGGLILGVDALRAVWPEAPHQRCQEHFLSNVAEDVLGYDTQLRKQMRQDLGGLPKVTQLSKGDPFL